MGKHIVIDTNVVVAAAFRPSSASARVLERAARGDFRLIWDEATLEETERIVRKIPPLSWAKVAHLFRAENRYGGATHPDAFPFVRDPEDRKFAALAAAADATLVTMDQHLLEARGHTEVFIVTPGELLESDRELSRDVVAPCHNGASPPSVCHRPSGTEH